MAAAETVGLAASFICLFFVAGSVSEAKTFTRKITVELNPGTTVPPPGGDLLHIRSVGTNDTLHFLFCGQGAPTLLLVHTNTSSSTVTVNWPEFEARNISGSLRVDPESSILYSTAIVYSRLLEYDDVNNTAQVTPYIFPPYELQNVSWSRMKLSGLEAQLCGAVANGSLCIKLSAFELEGRGKFWPSFLHTANSSQLDVWLDGILPRAMNSRFLLELQAVGGANPLSRVEIYRSIDDEFTPSIFKVSQWVSTVNGSSEVLGYAQWKPVAYRSSPPALGHATPCHNSDPLPQSGADVAAASALIRAFYSEPQAFGLNISFGLAGEPFYNSTRFLSWTVLMGIGSPPVDSFSPVVVVIMAVGLGAPLVLLLLGGVFVCARKRTTASASTYEPIN